MSLFQSGNIGVGTHFGHSIWELRKRVAEADLKAGVSPITSTRVVQHTPLLPCTPRGNR